MNESNPTSDTSKNNSIYDTTKNNLEKKLELINNSIIISYLATLSIILNVATLNINKDKVLSEINDIDIIDDTTKEDFYTSISDNLALIASLLLIGNNFEQLNQVLLYPKAESNEDDISSAERSVLASIIALVAINISQQ